ncbi:MAG: ankyrin repeat domain-containing protein, partial [archaeon]|nr:ankyrin repeat domain-containing protein [archaeon]
MLFLSAHEKPGSHSKILVAVSEDRRLLLFDSEKRVKRISRLPLGTSAVTCAHFDPLSNRLFVGNESGKLLVCDLAMNVLGSFLAHHGRVSALHYDSHTQVVYTAGPDCRLAIFHFPSRLDATPLRPLSLVPQSHDESPITAVHVAAADRLLFTGTAGGVIRVWRTFEPSPDGGRPLYLLRTIAGAHKGPITAFLWISALRHLCSSGSDHSLKIWFVPLEFTIPSTLSSSTLSSSTLSSSTYDPSTSDLSTPRLDLIHLTWLDLLRFTRIGKHKELAEIVDRFCAVSPPLIDVNHSGPDGNTCLHLAASGESKIVHKLIAEGRARIDVTNAMEQLPLHFVQKTSVAMLLLPGSNRKSFLNRADKQGRTPLHYVAKTSRDTSLARFLLDQGAALNVRDNAGDSPLNLAVQGLNKKMVAFLLECKASPNYEAGDSQRTPLHTVVAREYEDLMMGSLMGSGPIDGEKTTPPFAVFTMLLNAGAQTNAVDSHGDTPLHLAAQHNLTRFVDGLLKHHASPLLRNHDKMTPAELTTDAALRAL